MDECSLYGSDNGRGGGSDNSGTYNHSQIYILSFFFFLIITVASLELDEIRVYLDS